MKLGIHIQNDGPTLEFARRLKENGLYLPVVLAVNNPGIAPKIKAIDPRTKIILRFYGDEDWGIGRHIEEKILSPEKIAQGLLGRIRELNPSLNPEELKFVDYINVINECGVRGRENYIRLGQTSIILSNLIQIWLGRPSAHLGIAAGSPEWEEMIALRDCGFYHWLKMKNEILLVHEGLMDFKEIGVGLESPIQTGFGQSIPGLPRDVADRVKNAGWLVFRYRYHREAAGFDVPICVSEFYSGGTYDISGLRDVVERTFWYIREADKDNYLLGVCPFTCGPHYNWLQQNYDPFYTAPNGFIDSVISVYGKKPMSLRPENPIGKKAVLSRNINVNLRSGPSTTHHVLTVLFPGTVLPIREVSGDWLKVTYNGWVNKNFVTIV